MVEFNSLPQLARENVFKYMVIGDMRACRLVCKAWYQHFDQPRFRDKEHFVFEEPMMSSVDEISEVLLGYKGSGVNVTFIDVPLGELDFEDFGDKIRGIRVCVRDSIFSAHDPGALLDVLSHTLNIRYFHYHKLKNCWKKYTTWRMEENTFPEIIGKLHRRKLRFNNLRCFDTTPTFSYSSKFFEIFPRLRSLRSRCMHLHSMVRSDGLLTMEDLAEMGKINVFTEYVGHNTWEIERDFLLSLPKLKKLDVSFQFGYTGRECLQRAVDTFLNFFTHQTELETLRISFKCHDTCDTNHVEVHEKCTDGGYHYDAAKQLSFHILRSCAKLKVLHLKLRGVRMRFSGADLEEFVRLTRLSNIRDLMFPQDVLQRAAFRSHFALLHLESLKLHHFLNVYNLRGRITTEAYAALSTFLHSNETLVRMKVQSIALRLPEGIVLANRDVASIIHGPEKLLTSVHHDRLEHLAIDFHYSEPLEGILFIEHLMSLELPRLSSLKLGKKREWRLPLRSPADAGTDERFEKWIQKMRRLKILYLHLWWLSFEEVRNICEPLPELQVLAFSNSVDGDCEPKLLDVFNGLPALMKIWYHGSRYTPEICRRFVAPSASYDT